MLDLTSIRLEVPQVRTTTSTGWKILLVARTESVGHAAVAVADLAHDQNIGGLAGNALPQAQPVAAVRAPLMHVIDPGEVIEMPVLASDDEPSGYNRGGLARLGAVGVDVPRPIWPIRLGLERE